MKINHQDWFHQGEPEGNQCTDHDTTNYGV